MEWLQYSNVYNIVITNGTHSMWFNEYAETILLLTVSCVYNVGERGRDRGKGRDR